MNAVRTLFLLAAGLSVALSNYGDPVMEIQSLIQFRTGILCTMPKSWPLWDYADYGCYCGLGGSGTPVDELDRCCEVHDNCYGDAEKLKECWSFFHNPYTKMYSSICDKESKTITCNKKNNKCEMFICECDRKAAECFAKSPWITEHEHLPSDRCQ
ncbi:phospholipase A2, minor isoenzyme-like isoform X3 [Hippoglossus stenolepis]|uniref:phospholipase A2, minor isoenzyme-like isoform X3 n=1 Tax=Hippoglossus stenolepis TaxID=195615 RepID=UPI001FAE9939|nr:phospholipase A2, minor isoenzyme-like isoform X3 [Hippoglossus stenolepis]